MTILERIKLNSAKHPERVVMRTQYGFGEMTMKWGELDAFSDKLAYYLTKELRTNKPIIVYGHKHPMILVCFLACVKSVCNREEGILAIGRFSLCICVHNRVEFARKNTAR